MPLLDIAISQPCSCFFNNILAFRRETLSYSSNKFVVGDGRGLGFASQFSWITFPITKRVSKNLNMGRVEVWRGRLMIKAVATLEIASVSSRNEGVNGYENMLRMDIDSVRSNSSKTVSQSSSEDSTEVAEREKLRRMRISKANKGNMAWNKGRKHSPETLQRIKERTRLAMQDPKVKMKLVNLGHAQTEDTRVKIGSGVRLGWARRRERMMVQETCHYEWQNLIAESSRKGLSGEEEMQWDSYEMLDKQLELEWLRSVEVRKNMARPKGSKRAPKSAEQKRKISQAISSKWADAEYRNRVCSGLAKFHGISEKVERKPRRKPSGDGQTQTRSPRKEKTNNLSERETKSQVPRVRVKRSRAQSYKDPFASYKLEMLKNIRAQRASAVNQKSEAITRAKLLIFEAEKAVQVLELAAQNSPEVQSSLIESRTLIAEAIQFLESIKNEDPVSLENDNLLSENLTAPAPYFGEETDDTDTHTRDLVYHRKVNGVHTLPASDITAEDFSFNEKFILPDFVNGHASYSSHKDALEAARGFYPPSSNSSRFAMDPADPKPNPTGSTNYAEKPLVKRSDTQSENTETTKGHANTVKKWVRGRLVEVAEDD